MKEKKMYFYNSKGLVIAKFTLKELMARIGMEMQRLVKINCEINELRISQEKKPRSLEDVAEHIIEDPDLGDEVSKAVLAFILYNRDDLQLTEMLSQHFIHAIDDIAQ